MHQHFTTLESTYVSLFGTGDQIASLIEEELHVTLKPRDQQLEITGENEEDVLIAAQCADPQQAALIVQTAGIFWYLPVLLLSGVLTGVLIGILTGRVLAAFGKSA